MNMMQVAGTMPYWLPVEQARQERTAQRAMLVAEARAGGQPTTPQPPRQRRSFVPRIAGALGLF